MDAEAAKERVVAEVDRLADLLVHVSHQIHDHPELAYEEHFAHDLLCDTLADEGLAVERHAYGLPTAFVARAGRGDPVIGVLCEYDALPGLGHGCGHNIIAAAGLGAGLAAARVADAVGGTVVVVGTPAEEGGGGKQKLIDAGAFDGIDAAMMIHPAAADLTTISAIAVQQVWARYYGKAAHAAAAPHQGRNALDAAVLGYLNVAALRQHIRPDERLHGIFTRGGDKPNIVPEFAETHWYIRARTIEDIAPLAERVAACLRAGADAAGCEIDLEWDTTPYADMVDNEPLLALYAANAARLGRVTADPRADTAVVGSTDMGNVSHKVPSIHPMIKCAPDGTAIHTPAFAQHARSSDGDQAVIDGAKAMALTVVDLWCEPHHATRLAEAHTRRGRA
jgi:amidohydrolase